MYRLSRSELKALEMSNLKFKLWIGLSWAFMVGMVSIMELIVYPSKAWLVFALIVISILLFGLMYAKNYFSAQLVMHLFAFFANFILIGLILLGLWEVFNLMLIFLGMFYVVSALLDHWTFSFFIHKFLFHTKILLWVELQWNILRKIVLLFRVFDKDINKA